MFHQDQIQVRSPKAKAALERRGSKPRERPFTSDQIAEALIRNHGLVQDTANELGVLKGTLSNWIRADIDLLICRQELVVQNEQALLDEFIATRDARGTD